MSVFATVFVLPDLQGSGTSVVGRFGDFVNSRLLTNTFSCVFVRFCPRLELDVAVVSGSGSFSPPCLDPRRLALSGDSSSSPSLSFASSSWFSCSCTFDAARGSAASSVVVDLGFCGVSMTDFRFSSDQLCPASRRPLRPAKRQNFICLPTSVQDCQIPVQPLEDVQELFLQTPPVFVDTVRPWHGLHIAASETKNEPGFMSNNPSFQGAVGGWSVLCALLHCRQHCTHLSLQLFLIVFNSSVALLSPSGRTSNHCSF